MDNKVEGEQIVDENKKEVEDHDLLCICQICIDSNTNEIIEIINKSNNL